MILLNHYLWETLHLITVNIKVGSGVSTDMCPERRGEEEGGGRDSILLFRAARQTPPNQLLEINLCVYRNLVLHSNVHEEEKRDQRRSCVPPSMTDIAVINPPFGLQRALLQKESFGEEVREERKKNPTPERNFFHSLHID